jgi:hypothetical protein
MKLTGIIISIFVITSCCTSHKAVQSENLTASKMEIKNIEFENEMIQEAPLVIYDSHTRGYHFTATVYNSFVTVVKELNGKAERLNVDQEDINDLKIIISKMSLKEIRSYEAPTKKRHYDGAPHTTISVFSNDEKFSSQQFDGGFPPEALAVLVNKVLSLSTEK